MPGRADPPAGPRQGQHAAQGCSIRAGRCRLHNSYLYDKEGNTYHVTVFVMRVTEVAQDWQERDQRQRAWLSPAGAVRRVDDAGLVEVLRAALALERAALSAS